jgi:spore coat protein H
MNRLISLAFAACTFAQSQNLFQSNKVWTIRLSFTAQQWEAMEPKGDGFPGMPGGPPGGGPGGPGPAMFVAPAFLKGDTNHDGRLSQQEFAALGASWFSQWDRQKLGRLSADQLRAGISSTFPEPEFGGPGPGGPPPMTGAKRNGMSAVSGVDFEYVHADLDFDGTLLRNIAVRYKGNNSYMQSRNSIKRPLKLDLNKYVKGQKLAGLTKLNLHNNVTDASWMNEPLSYRLFRDAAVPAPRTAYARVFITVPGKYDRKYFGLYSLVEDIDGKFAANRFDSSAGAIFKPVTRDLFAHLGEDWTRYERIYDPKTDLTEKQQRRVLEFAKLVASYSDSDFASALPSFLDLDEFARFMAVTVLLCNNDSILSMGQNFYVYLHPATNKFLFLPWDLDHSFGQFPMGGSDLSIQKPWQGQNRFLERVFAVPAFKSAYLARIAEFNKTLFVADRIARQVDETAAAIRPAVAEESQSKLARFDKVVAGQAVEMDMPGGPGPGPMGAMKPIKAFVGPRARSVADQLAGKSQGESSSGPRFGGPRGPGGPPGGFGPAMFLPAAFLATMDANKDGIITRDEFTRGFEKWFQSWGGTAAGGLTEEQIRAGINRDLAPRPGMPGMPGMPGGRPPFQP